MKVAQLTPFIEAYEFDNDGPVFIRTTSKNTVPNLLYILKDVTYDNNTLFLDVIPTADTRNITGDDIDCFELVYEPENLMAVFSR